MIADTYEATPLADKILIKYYLAIWDSYGVPSSAYKADPEAVVQKFISEGRRAFELKAFVATVDGVPAGSAVGQFRAAPYPIVTEPAHNKTGYVWSVYVEPSVRRQVLQACS
jgi:hypothetical protein